MQNALDYVILLKVAKGDWYYYKILTCWFLLI